MRNRLFLQRLPTLGTALLKRRGGKTPPRVRIPPSPLKNAKAAKTLGKPGVFSFFDPTSSQPERDTTGLTKSRKAVAFYIRGYIHGKLPMPSLQKIQYVFWHNADGILAPRSEGRMVLCSCCEMQLGHSLTLCACVGSYCSKRLRCELHCRCDETDVPVVVAAAQQERMKPGPAGRESGSVIG